MFQGNPNFKNNLPWTVITLTFEQLQQFHGNNVVLVRQDVTLFFFLRYGGCLTPDYKGVVKLIDIGDGVIHTPSNVCLLALNQTSSTTLTLTAKCLYYLQQSFHIHTV